MPRELFDLHGTGFLGCGWHRDRGPAACTSDLRVGVAELEERVLGAIREQILVPDVVAEAVRVAMAELKQALRVEDPAALLRRLAEIGATRERLLDLVERDAAVLDHVASRLERLRAEEAEVRGKLGAAEAAPPDLAVLRPLIEERVRDLRMAFAGSPDEQRAALRAVLKEERLRVSADPEVHFRVNGLLWIPLAEPARDHEGPRAGLEVGSGGLQRHAPPPSPRIVVPYRVAG